MYCLYRHIRLDKNEVFYIGIGNLGRPYRKHGRNKFWKSVANKTNYEVEIMIESEDLEFLKSKEIEFIELYGRRDLGKGTLVNMTTGGDLADCRKGSKASEETKKKISEAGLKRNHRDRNNHQSKYVYQYDRVGKFIKRWDSTKQVQRELGYPNQRISEVCGKRSSLKTYKGFMWSYNDLGQYCESREGKYITRQILQLDNDSCKILNKFPSASEAARIVTGRRNSTSRILDCCRGKRKSAFKFKWKYSE